VTIRRLALATAHELSTEAGVEAFARGGNALDAALAAAVSLTVTLPDNCSPGGDLFALVRKPHGEVVAINASGPAARATDPNAVRERHGLAMPTFGIESVTVPGVIAGWERIWRLGADRPWAEAFGDAIEQARSGVPVADSIAEALARFEERLRRDPGMASIYFPAGRPLASGQTMVQPQLATSLERLAEEGPSAFYEGPLGSSWLEAMRAQGSVLTAEDLAAFRAEEAEPVRATRGGQEVLTAPPNSQAPLLIKTLSLLGADAPDPLSADAAPRLAAAFQAAIDARARYLADPRAAEVPLELLTGPEGEAGGGTEHRPGGTGDTVAVVAADSEGWAISLIQSIFDSFGSGFCDPRTGIIAHNRGSFFSLDPASPNVLAPGKRPAHTLSPALVQRGGELEYVLGTMGGLGQTQILTHVLLQLRRGKSPAEAVGAPRWTVGSIETIGDAASVQAEEDVPADAVEALRAAGWEVQRIPARSLDVGNAAAIRRGEAGELDAAADPRGSGRAVVR